LSANGIAIQGAGFGTILQATNLNESAIELQGNAPSISNLKTQVVAPDRSNQPQATAIWILNATNASVKNVILQGAASNGVRLDGATYATISNNLVLGTNADGIAATNGASHNKIANNLVYQSADDAAYHIPYGRGFAAAGSTDGVFNGNTINGTTWIGIYAETDTSSNTQVTSNYTIENNVVLNANTTVASNYTTFNGNPVGGWLISGNGMVVSNNQSTGSMPTLSTVLGWDPTPYMVDRYSFNPTYVPGTGPGATN
jgi:parallel beta-helix repeat protein